MKLVSCLIVLMISSAAWAAGEHPATAALLADVKQVAPGSTFTLGILFKMQPGWHVYWLNPGEAGMATAVTFHAPPGFEVGELRWPLPTSFARPDQPAAYGYADSVLLTAVVKAPAALQPGVVAITADVKWLVCNEDKCLPGKAALAHTLRRGDAEQPANSELFKTWAQRLPSEKPERLASVRAEGHTIIAEWRGTPPKKVEWFPGGDPAVEVGNIKVQTQGSQTRVSFELTVLPNQTPAAGVMKSLLVYEDESGRHGVYVPVTVK